MGLERLLCGDRRVSHVLYLANAAQRGQKISAFELELQAEIDKYLVLVTAVGMECRDALKRLFASFTLDEDVVNRLGAERRRATVQLGRFANELGSIP